MITIIDKKCDKTMEPYEFSTIEEYEEYVECMKKAGEKLMSSNGQRIAQI